MNKIITGKKSSFWKRITQTGLIIFTTALSITAQPTVDPNPDSPTPVLIGEFDSLRALATATGKNIAVNNLSKIKSPAFPLFSKAVIYRTCLQLSNKIILTRNFTIKMQISNKITPLQLY